MVVLTAIGRFFKKIWDWIKQTAWIQPLLIVGIIFGVIFSIPSIVKAVNASKKEKSTYNTYYHNYKYTLEGHYDEDGKYTSPADEFTYALEGLFDGKDEEFKKSYGDLGDKFFVAYVAKDCEKCDEAKDGFSTFEKKLNKDSNKAYQSLTGEDEEFHLVTIFTDDENDQTEDNKSAFVYYLERHQSFFESAGSVAYVTPYYENGHLSDSDLEALETADPDNFLTPTIFLVELSDKAAKSKLSGGVTEIMFGVDGSDKNEKARTLLDCWNHDGDFSYNPSNK